MVRLRTHAKWEMMDWEIWFLGRNCCWSHFAARYRTNRILRVAVCGGLYKSFIEISRNWKQLIQNVWLRNRVQWVKSYNLYCIGFACSISRCIIGPIPVSTFNLPIIRLISILFRWLILPPHQSRFNVLVHCLHAPPLHNILSYCGGATP